MFYGSNLDGNFHVTIAAEVLESRHLPCGHRQAFSQMSRKHGENYVQLETTKMGGYLIFRQTRMWKLLLNTPNFYKHIQKSDINGSQWEMVCNWIYDILKRTSEKMASVHIITCVCLIKPSDFGRRFSEACPHSSHIHLV